MSCNQPLDMTLMMFRSNTGAAVLCLLLGACAVQTPPALDYPTYQATTTPVPQDVQGPQRDPADVLRYNEAARWVMDAADVAKE